LVKNLLRVSKKRGHSFGTAPVFLTSICTILGAIMFLRFGYAVGHLGLIGAMSVIILAHLITIPTGLAVSEIATNLKVGGGGEYYIISRSFGTSIGSSIGVMLYSAQIISVAFYVIAFAEIFKADFFFPIRNFLSPIINLFETYTHIPFEPRLVSIPAALIIISLIFKRGAKIGITALWGIFILLIAAVVVFVLGGSVNGGNTGEVTATIENPNSFAMVFAIVFPAFTGMTAGVGLSGDLKNPRKSIPNGVLLAITVGLIIYILVIVKLFYSAPLDDLANNQHIMYDIALWGPLVLVGLTAATISSAIGSILIAPRTLQALGNDKVFPGEKVNNVLGKGIGKENEPRNALMLSGFIAVLFVFMGNLNVVASIITMFFLITYGSVCTISFLEHFAGNPSYRPTFRTKWYLSFIGAILCFYMMFQIDLVYAIIAIIIMVLIYKSHQYAHSETRSFAVIFQGVMFQLSRWMKIVLQKSGSKPDKSNWRPSVIAISSHAVDRAAPKDLLRWISDYYGFGTLIHYIKGRLDRKAVKNSKRIQKELVSQISVSESNYSVSTVVSPSLRTAVAQVVQFSGISGLDNNTILFEYNKNRMDELEEIVDGCQLVDAVRFNICVLRSTEHNFGFKEKIHIWLTKDDYRNGNLMILLSFILMAHPDWAESEITIFTAFPKAQKDERISKIKHLIAKGRLPITLQNVQSFTYKDKESFNKLIYRQSKSADLVIIGFTQKQLREMGLELFKQHEGLRETLFISAGESIYIS
jgi:amino acid transporter